MGPTFCMTKNPTQWVKRNWVVLGLFGALLMPVSSGAGERVWTHPFDLPQPSDAPNTLLALIEIPAGSHVKYEIDPSHGHLMVDRVLKSNHRYPAHYGAIPSWAADDGDLMDILVVSDADLLPGALIKVVPIGVAVMHDQGDVDDKLIAIPAAQTTKTHSPPLAMAMLPPELLTQIETFFRQYKALDDGTNPIEWRGFEGWEGVMMRWCRDDRIALPNSPCPTP